MADISKTLSDDKCIEDLREYRQKMIKRNMQRFAEILPSYNYIIALTTNIIDELGIEKNPLSYYVVYTYLMWNGYLSNNKYFYYSNNELFSFDGFFGFDVINGKGCCRSITALCCDIFKHIGFDNVFFSPNSSIIKCRRHVIDISRYDKEGEIEKPKLNVTLKTKEIDPIGNHASMLIKINDNYYILDSTNLSVYKVMNDTIAVLCNGIGECHIKKWGLRIYENLDYTKLNELISSLEKQDVNRFLLDSEIKDIIDESLINCQKRRCDIYDFYNNISTDISLLTRKLNK